MARHAFYRFARHAFRSPTTNAQFPKRVQSMLLDWTMKSPDIDSDTSPYFVTRAQATRLCGTRVKHNAVPCRVTTAATEIYPLSSLMPADSEKLLRQRPPFGIGTGIFLDGRWRMLTKPSQIQQLNPEGRARKLFIDATTADELNLRVAPDARSLTVDAVNELELFHASQLENPGRAGPPRGLALNPTNGNRYSEPVHSRLIVAAALGGYVSPFWLTEAQLLKYYKLRFKSGRGHRPATAAAASGNPGVAISSRTGFALRVADLPLALRRAFRDACPPPPESATTGVVYLLEFGNWEPIYSSKVLKAFKAVCLPKSEVIASRAERLAAKVKAVAKDERLTKRAREKIVRDQSLWVTVQTLEEMDLLTPRFFPAATKLARTDQTLVKTPGRPLPSDINAIVSLLSKTQRGLSILIGRSRPASIPPALLKSESEKATDVLDSSELAAQCARCGVVDLAASTRDKYYNAEVTTHPLEVQPRSKFMCLINGRSVANQYNDALSSVALKRKFTSPVWLTVQDCAKFGVSILPTEVDKGVVLARTESRMVKEEYYNIDDVIGTDDFLQDHPPPEDTYQGEVDAAKSRKERPAVDSGDLGAAHYVFLIEWRPVLTPGKVKQFDKLKRPRNLWISRTEIALSGLMLKEGVTPCSIVPLSAGRKSANSAAGAAAQNSRIVYNAVQTSDPVKVTLQAPLYLRGGR